MDLDCNILTVSPDIICGHVREVGLDEVGEVRDGVLEAVLDEPRAVELPVLGDARPQPEKELIGNYSTPEEI